MEEDNEAAIQFEELNNLLAQIEASIQVLKSADKMADSESKVVVLQCLQSVHLYIQDQVMDLEPRNDELLS